MTIQHSSLGTLLRSLVDELDSAVAGAYRDAGLDYKPRYTPVIRALAEHGPLRIKDIAEGMGVSHSAVSQTVSALVRKKWVKLELGDDSRERIVHLTRFAKARLPLLEAQWSATTAAAASLDDTLGFSLEEALRSALAALRETPFSARIAHARGKP